MIALPHVVVWSPTYVADMGDVADCVEYLVWRPAQTFGHGWLRLEYRYRGQVRLVSQVTL